MADARDYPLKDVTPYLSFLLNKAVDEKTPEPDSRLVARARQQLCDALVDHFYYLDERDQFQAPESWKLRSGRDQLRYLARGHFGLVFIKRVGSTSVVLKITKLGSENDFETEVRNQTLAAKYGIAPTVFDSFVCTNHVSKGWWGYGVIVMTFLENYIPLEDLRNRNLTEKSVQTLLGNLFRIVDELVNQCELNIIDFQLMVNPVTLDVQIIDFGLAEKILDSVNKKEIQDELFIKQCNYFTDFCVPLLNNEEWEATRENASNRETYDEFRERALRFHSNIPVRRYKNMMNLSYPY